MSELGLKDCPARARSNAMRNAARGLKLMGRYFIFKFRGNGPQRFVSGWFPGRAGFGGAEKLKVDRAQEGTLIYLASLPTLFYGRGRTVA